MAPTIRWSHSFAVTQKLHHILAKVSESLGKQPVKQGLARGRDFSYSTTEQKDGSRAPLLHVHHCSLQQKA